MRFPVFFPDATRGVIRSLDSEDIKESGTEGVIVNTYHLMSEPGTEVIQKAGGIKQFMNLNGFVISDSGGFQVLSLIYKDPSFGKINDDGVTFLKGSKGKKEKYAFTPERSIQVQFALDSDIMICLDDCPPQKASREKVEECVNRTIEWAKRCKEEFERQVALRQASSFANASVDRQGDKNKKRSYKAKGNAIFETATVRSEASRASLAAKQLSFPEADRPLLFAVIQGNDYKDLRKRCAEQLINIGFDGYGFGGWPMTQENTFNERILKYTASLMPDHLPKYALGVGMPEDIVRCVKMGYTIFDTVLPTRDARHQRLYVFTKDPRTTDVNKTSHLFDYVQIKRGIYENDHSPISTFCDCFTCKRYSRSYLHHLFHIEDSTAHRLATIHNLRTYQLLIEHIRLRLDKRTQRIRTH